MHLLTMRELDQASSDDQGICLECGLVQDFAERESMRFGLCLDCEAQRVLRTTDLRDGLLVMQLEGDES